MRAEAANEQRSHGLVRSIVTMRFAVILLLSFAALAQTKPADDEIVWLDNYQAALQEAKKTGKPIFLEYRCEP